MHWILKRRLKQIRQRAEPDPRFVQALEERLVSQIKPRGWQSPFLRFGAALASLVCVVGGATGVFAYESDQVVPGHFLYPVRETIEHVEEQIAPTPEKRVEVAVKHLERRLHQYDVLRRSNAPISPLQVENLDVSIQRAVDETALLSRVEEKPKPEGANEVRPVNTAATRVSPPGVPTPPKPRVVLPIHKQEEDAHPPMVLEKPSITIEQKIQTLTPEYRKRFEEIQREREAIVSALARSTSTLPNAGLKSQEDRMRLQQHLLEVQRRIELERRRARPDLLQSQTGSSVTPVLR